MKRKTNYFTRLDTVTITSTSVSSSCHTQSSVGYVWYGKHVLHCQTQSHPPVALANCSTQFLNTLALNSHTMRLCVCLLATMSPHYLNNHWPDSIQTLCQGQCQIPLHVRCTCGTCAARARARVLCQGHRFCIKVTVELSTNELGLFQTNSRIRHILNCQTDADNYAFSMCVCRSAAIRC